MSRSLRVALATLALAPATLYAHASFAGDPGDDTDSERAAADRRWNDFVADSERSTERKTIKVCDTIYCLPYSTTCWVCCTTIEGTDYVPVYDDSCGWKTENTLQQ